MNKRDFVLGACATVAAGVAQAGVAPADGLLQPCGSGRLARLPDLVEDTGYAAWTRYIGESFDSPAMDAPLVLGSVERHHLGAGAEQFTLRFQSASGCAVETTMQRLRHKATGQHVAVFLQKAGADADADGGSTYRAEFNVLG